MRTELKLGILSLARRVDFKGKARLLDLLGIGPSNKHLAPSGMDTVACRYGISIATRDNRDVMFRELLVNGHYQDDVLVALRQLLRPGAVFWDIGANYGFMSIFVDKVFEGRVRTVAFEPSPIVLPELRRNLELNRCRNVEVQPFCLSDRIGTVPFYVSKDQSWNATMIREFAESSAEDIEIEVESSTIDVCVGRLPAPDVIKLDVEGAEHLVIAGGREFLARRRPALIAEYNVEAIRDAGLTPEAYLGLLRSLGYRIHLLPRPWVGRHRWSSLRAVGEPRSLPPLCNLILLDPGSQGSAATR